MSSPTVYSFSDVVGVIFNPVSGTFLFSGQIGTGSFTVGYTTVQSTIDVAADGAKMISAIPGGNGNIAINAQQTSSLHTYLFQLFNALNTQRLQGILANWAATTITITAVYAQTQHLLTGVCFEKPPDIPYGSAGTHVTWNLLAAEVATVITGEVVSV